VAAIGFRPMTTEDFGLLHDWLHEPETAHWFRSLDRAYDGVVEHYLPCLDGRDATKLWIVTHDGEDAGWLQSFLLADEPEYGPTCIAAGADPGAGGIDYLLGDAAVRDRGVGSSMLRCFVEEVAFDEWGWPQVVAGPDPANVRSWRALEKAGFTFLGDIVSEDGPERLMQRTRMPG
jgi:aminoglycoside 6'-N-acetyltransferase